MSGVKLTGDWAKFNKCLDKMKNLNFKAMHEQIGETLTSSARERFSSQSGPDGRPWQKSRRAAVEGGETLTDNAILKNSITFKARVEGVAVGTNVKYAPIHQHGGVITAKRAKYLRFRVGKSWARKKSVKMPARPFIGISEGDMGEIRDVVNRHIRKALKK
jgi:phage virion morphogenesis protein